MKYPKLENIKWYGKDSWQVGFGHAPRTRPPRGPLRS